MSELVSLKSLVLHLLEFSVLGVLGNVAVVVTDHLDEESLCLILAVVAQHLGVDNADDLLTVLGELELDLGLVAGQGVTELGVLGVLLDGGDGAAGGAFA